MNFSEQFNAIENLKAKILLEHCLFDKQVNYCNNLKIINDDKRIGLILRDQEIFIYKRNLKHATVCNNLFVMADDRLRISIIVTKNRTNI